jgi:hypothetical protein
LPPQKTQPPHTAKKKRGRAWFIKWTISKQTPQTINNKWEPEGYRIGTVSGKTICHRDLNHVLGCTNITLAPTGSHINKQAQVVLVK